MAKIDIIDTDASTICEHRFCGFKDGGGVRDASNNTKKGKP